jgi:hypothetical protein
MSIRSSSIIFALACVTLGGVVYSQSAAAFIPQSREIPVLGNAMTFERLADSDITGLNEKIDVDFKDATVSQILDWFMERDSRFVASASEFGDARLTLEFNDVTVGQALDMLADLLAAKWERDGDVFKLSARYLPVAGEGDEAAPQAKRYPVDENARRVYERAYERYGPKVDVKSRSTAPKARSQGSDFMKGLPAMPAMPAMPKMNFPQGHESIRIEQKDGKTVGYKLGKDGKWVPMSEAETKEWQKKWEAWGEKFGKEMEVWGERFGKDMEAWGEKFGKEMELHGKQWEKLGEMKGFKFDGEKLAPMDEKQMQELRKRFSEMDPEKMRKHIEESLKHFETHGKGHQLTPQQRAKMERELQKMGPEIEKSMRDAMREMERAQKEGKLRGLSQEEAKQLEKHLGELNKMKFDELKIRDGGALELKNLKGDLKLHDSALQELKRVNPEAHDELRRALHEAMAALERALKALEREGGVRGTAPRVFVAPPSNVKILPPGAAVAPKADSKVRIVKPTDVKVLAPIALPGAPGVAVGGFSFTKDSFEKLMKSLTAEQQAKHKKNGYLTASDLTAEQRKLIGGLPEGNFAISYTIDGRTLTIKSK